MAGMLLPAASLLGAIYAGSRGDGGGSEFGPQQERLFDTQADIAEMMKGLYESRIANEEQYLGDAMSRVFQYADRMQNRSPDLLHAPGIFEFMPKGRQREGQSPEWKPFTPEGGTQQTETVNPPLDDQGLRDLEALNPVTDIVPPVDMGALAGLMPWQIKKMLEQLMPGSYTKLSSGGAEDLEEALGQKSETDTDWDAWLNDMPETLRSLERTMEDTLGTRDKPELNNPYRQQYDPKELEELMTRVMSISDFTPPGEYSGPFEDYIDPTTLEVVGPTVPDRSPIPDIDVDEFLRAIQGEAGSGVADFTGLIPGIVPEPAWRTRRGDARDDAAVEAGDYMEITPEQVANLKEYSSGPGEFAFDIIERDGKYYLVDAVSGVNEPGWFGKETDSTPLSIDQLERMLSGEYDAKAMQEEVWNRRNPRTRTAPTGTRRT